MTLQEPFKDLLPPLSRDERDALAEEVRSDGVRDPVVVDEAGNILDGHNRYAMDPNARTVVKEGLTPAEKKAFVLRTNFARRNLSPEQKRELLTTKKRIAAELRSEGRTQEETAKLLSVGQKTVDDWENRTNSGTAISSIPDVRVKIHPNEHQVIAARLDKGETQEAVAADYKVTQRAVGKIAEKIRREREKEQLAMEFAATPEGKAEAEAFKQRLDSDLDKVLKLHAHVDRVRKETKEFEDKYRVALAVERMLHHIRLAVTLAKKQGELKDFDESSRKIMVQLTQLNEWMQHEWNT